jgi:hypothetical protein
MRNLHGSRARAIDRRVERVVAARNPRDEGTNTTARAVSQLPGEVRALPGEVTVATW